MTLSISDPHRPGWSPPAPRRLSSEEVVEEEEEEEVEVEEEEEEGKERARAMVS